MRSTAKTSRLTAFRRTGLLLFLAAFWSATGLVSANDQGTEDDAGYSVVETSEAFSESIDVELVNVEVRVTDRRGRPLTGLKAEDFKVFEDRAPMEILHFAEVSAESISRSLPSSTKGPSSSALTEQIRHRAPPIWRCFSTIFICVRRAGSGWSSRSVKCSTMASCRPTSC